MDTLRASVGVYLRRPLLGFRHQAHRNRHSARLRYLRRGRCMSQDNCVQIDQQDGVMIATLQGEEFDHARTDQLSAEVKKAASNSPGNPLVLDMSQVTFMASLTLGKLIELGNGFKTEGRRMVLVGLPAKIRQLMAVSKIDELFEIHDDMQSARQALHS